MPKKVVLNTNQKKAIKHKTGPLLVVAGAGTGKTRVITERVRYLIQKEKNNPQQILALTFTDKAAAEMLERIGDIMPLGYEEPWVYTFHAFADRLLRTEGMEIGLDPGYKVLSKPKQWLLLRKNLFELDLDYFRPLGNPTKFIDGVLKFISRLQDENITPKDLQKYYKKTKNTLDKDDQKRWAELVHIYQKYQEIKIESSKLDFGDLITWSIKLFTDRPNILKKYQEQFQHILVDEFQDTNYAQYELVKLLFPQKATYKRSLLVVGDDSQSIYKFRGAAVSNILEFMRDFPKAQMITLLENYRSVQQILDPAYKLIQNNNPDTLESKLNISKELVSQIDKKGPKPEIIQAIDLEDEAELVISKIYEILAKEPQYTYKDFAILARANNHLEPFLLALRQQGIPYQLVGNRGLYDREEVRDIVAILKVVLDPSDSISLYRILNIPSFGISSAIISKLLSESRYQKKQLIEVVEESSDEKVVSLKEKLQKFQKEITKQTPVEFVYNLVHEAKYLNQFLEEETVENQLSVKNLDLFLNIVKRFEYDFHSDNKQYPTIVDLMDYLDLMIEAGDDPAQAEIEDIETVNLLTVHSSKGLEFPVIFVVNLVSDRFPTRNRRDTIEVPDELIKETLPSGNEHIQEERRLFYVGMTRAKKYLFMTLAKDYGGKREKRPSGFLEETGLKTKQFKKEAAKKKRSQKALFGVGSAFRDPGVIKIKGFEPDFMSYSQINTYETCPLKYKYSYVLRIPTLPSHNLSFGTSIHNTLKDFHQALMFRDDLTLEDVYKMYEKNWQPLGYLNEQHRKKRYESGKKVLETYFDKHKDEKIKHVALEKPFNLKIDGIRFYGRIDRIDPVKGGVEIVDYKTGNLKTQKDVDRDMQMAFYALGVKEALNMKPEKLSFYFVEGGEKLSTTRTDEQLKQARKQVKEVVKKVKKGSFEPKPGMHCKWCDYNTVCPFAYKK